MKAHGRLGRRPQVEVDDRRHSPPLLPPGKNPASATLRRRLGFQPLGHAAGRGTSATGSRYPSYAIAAPPPVTAGALPPTPDAARPPRHVHLCVGAGLDRVWGFGGWRQIPPLLLAQEVSSPRGSPTPLRLEFSMKLVLQCSSVA